jgi:hypothetical protein
LSAKVTHLEFFSDFVSLAEKQFLGLMTEFCGQSRVMTKEITLQEQ